ncbi:MAG TPA: DinB family protein [Thermoanaerobaculia bacterium]|nr:DinB family protein [Thermoanaerobaculia bacterium]
MSDNALSTFRSTFERETATTRKVLHAFPVDQNQFRPHERSMTAHMLGWIMVGEETLMLKVLHGEPLLTGNFPKPPATWQEVLDAFDERCREMLEAIDATDLANVPTPTFMVGPKQTGEIPPLEFLWFMLHDQIHHRGQFSVYLRMAGGKVPSIYGPSGDEPWF